MGYLGQGNETVPIYLSLHSPSFPIHLQEDKDNCLIFLAVSLLDNRSLSIILMIELFLCNKYLSFFLSWFWSNFLCFSWLCLFFLVGASASDSHSSFLFLSSFFCSCCLSSFWVVCLLVLVCVCVLFFFFSLLLLVFLLLCVLLFMTYVVLIWSSFISCFFACISFDCSCCCGFSPYCSSFSSCVFSSPQAPAHT